jgi:ADP-ribosylglycohydrolase
MNETSADDSIGPKVTPADSPTAAILFGLALGDALGWPTEFSSVARIKETYGPAGILEPPDPALYTDDTQMTVALAEGLLDAGIDADLDTQMNAVARQFVHWRHTAPERAPGTTCLRGVDRFDQGFPWHESGIKGSKGCGSAMRVAPIGLLYQRQPERLREIAESSSLITHGHPAALAASVGAAYLVKLALDGLHPRDWAAELLAVTRDMSEEFHAAIGRAVSAASAADEAAALETIGRGWTGEEAVALAFYCVLRYPDDYVACMRRAANTEGDSDSIACIAGGIMGARLGLAAIPEAWRNRCENRELLYDLARRLDAAMAAR